MVPAQRVKVPKGGPHHRLSKGHGTHEHPQSRCSLALCRLHLLSLVWEGGANEGTVVNHLRTTHYRLGLVCDQCFGCPTVTLDSLCWHGCQNCHKYCVASGSGLSTWPTHSTRSLHKGGKVVIFNQTLFPQKARRFNEGGTTHQSAESIFCSPALPTNSYFYPSCDQDCLRKMLLITAKAVSIKVDQNNNSNS